MPSRKSSYSENRMTEYHELLEQARRDGIEKFVVGAAILKDNQLLIVIRADDDNMLPGYAEIPGGGVDDGESLIDALHRETKEETNMDISEVLGYVGAFDYLSGSGEKARQFNFLLRPTRYDVALNPAEHSSFLWIPLDDVQLSELHMTPEMRRLIEEVRAMKF